MKKETKVQLILALSFAVLMSIPWLVPHTGFVALFGLVPLLCLERIATKYGTRRFWLWQYCSFLLWNLFTTFWVCNATVGGGLFAAAANALQMSLIFGLFRLSKKRLRGVLPYIFLAATWIAWERAYFDFQISWPWLVMGNAFARSISLVQWYDVTGTLGGSLWIWASNLGIFGLLVALSDGLYKSWNCKARTAAVGSLVLVLLAPVVASRVIWHSYDEVSEGKVDVVIGQPNFDPYQKFQSLSQGQQTSILLEVFDRALKERKGAEPLLLLAPETFTSDIVVDSYETSPTWRSFVEFLSSHKGTSMLFGASTSEFILPDREGNPNDYILSDGRRVRRHNSALTLDAEGNTEIFHKSKLVVGTEMTPFPKVILPLAHWLGVSIGRCVGQDEISLLHFGDVPLGCAVCYESVFGEYCTGYVLKGAKAMTIITNDAWWGNTPGYRQHLSYASLRAIELRRDIARCGNTGISCFIDQKGRILDQGPWWEQASLEGSVNLNSEITFFASHGDVTGRVCTFVFCLLLLYFLISLFARPKHK